MFKAETSAQLEQLLQHPAVWRGRSVAPQPTFATGFAALDLALPGGGWPRTGLIEILTPAHGVGELQLWLPSLAAFSQSGSSRWFTFVTPPFEPFAPAFVAAGVQLDRLLVVRAPQSLWAMEQAVASGACDIVFSWITHAASTDLRRLGLATERGGTPAVIFRPLEAARQSSPAVLRVAVEALRDGVRVRLIKSRGGERGLVDVSWLS